MKMKVGCAMLGIFVFGIQSAMAAGVGNVTAPAGAKLLLEVAADGVQTYICEAKAQGYEWVFKAPEANLFDARGRQVGTHFGGPTWKVADGSSVIGEVADRADAAVPGAIPWLLLRAKSHDGSGELSGVAFIRRAETKGGAAPKSGCDAAHVSEQARVRYSAEYQFFGGVN